MNTNSSQKDFPDFKSRYASVCQKIRDFSFKYRAENIERKISKTPQVIAVSKTHSADKIRAFFEATGHLDYGENYSQELMQKQELLRDLPIRWHFIGQLQTNKINKILRVATSIQTVSSMRHVEQIVRNITSLNQKHPLGCWLHVNICAEPQKSGINVSDALQFAQDFENATYDLRDRLVLCGLMVVPPSQYSDKTHANLSVLPQPYVDARMLADKIGQQELSLGMSDDLELAIRAGSTCVRIGTALFGERN